MVNISCFKYKNTYLRTMNLKNLLMWALIIFLSIGLFNLFKNPEKVNSNSNQMTFSKFLNEVMKK